MIESILEFLILSTVPLCGIWIMLTVVESASIFFELSDVPMFLLGVVITLVGICAMILVFSSP